jgi:pimeloyl-ACP methyl ester carboxylesterase
MKRLIAAGLVSGALLLVTGCGNSGYGTVTGQADLTSFNGNPGSATPSCSNPARPASTALYCPAAGILPYPFDVYFHGSTDGTLNIQPANPTWPNQASLNEIDGFSTNASIRERFNGPIDKTSLATPGAVVMIHINTNNSGPQAKAPVTPGPPFGAGTGAFAPLTGCVVGSAACATADYSVGVAVDDPTTLEITPLHPLAASTCLPTPPAMTSPCQTMSNGGNGEAYLVLLTKAITVGGVAAAPDVDFANFQMALASGGPTCPSITDPTLNGLCQLTGAHLGLAQLYAHVVPGFNPANVVASFHFSTESTIDSLELLALPTITKAQPFKANPTGITTAQAHAGLAGYADVYVGVLQIPYYLSKTKPVTGSWQAPPFALDKTSTLVTRFNPVPVPTEMLLIPALITVPNASSAYHKVFGGPIPPPNGWPVVIYQHGVVVNREYMLPVADSFANAGFVVVAIDLPLHGVTDKTDKLYATDANAAYTGLIPKGTGSIERTFDLDLNTNQGYTVIPGSPPDGVIDPTGSHFLNIESPVTARDNAREAAADLITLQRSLPNLAQSPVPIPVDMTRIHYVGHSMGGIVGTMFMAVTPPAVIPAATFANAGGNWALLAQTSPSFSPDILAGLAAQGIVPGTTLFAQYFRDLQTILDSADPINYIALTTAQHPIHMMTVVGTTPPPAGCTPSPPVPGCPDQTVPPPSTQALITASAYGPAGAAGALTRIARGQGPVYTVPGGIRGYVNFIDGYHGSLINPAESQAVTVEMQTEAVSFTGVPIPPAVPSANPPGTTLLIADPTGVVQN